jgi:cyclic pyranopterin phosphate synthase
MIDISQKEISLRRAIAKGSIVLKPKAFRDLMSNKSPKGDVFEAAKLAGINAAKFTPSILAYCHPLNLEKIKITFEPLKSQNTINVTAEVLCSGKTGVEMESLAAVSAACLTIYDMMKWAGQDMVINNIQLIHKSGGKSGVYQQ